MEKDMKIIQIDPFNDEHLELITAFEKKYYKGVDQQVYLSKILLDIRGSYKTREAFNTMRRNTKIKEENFFVIGESTAEDHFVLGCVGTIEEDLKKYTFELIDPLGERLKTRCEFMKAEVMAKPNSDIAKEKLATANNRLKQHQGDISRLENYIVNYYLSPAQEFGFLTFEDDKWELVDGRGPCRIVEKELKGIK